MDVNPSLFIGPPGTVVTVTVNQPSDEAWLAPIAEYPRLHKYLRRVRYNPTRGLGIRQQGIPEPIQARANKCQFGLGYRPRYGYGEEQFFKKSKDRMLGLPVQLTMNGYFCKEGSSEPLSGYPVFNTVQPGEMNLQRKMDINPLRPEVTALQLMIWPLKCKTLTWKTIW